MPSLAFRRIVLLMAFFSLGILLGLGKRNPFSHIDKFLPLPGNERKFFGYAHSFGVGCDAKTLLGTDFTHGEWPEDYSLFAGDAMSGITFFGGGWAQHSGVIRVFFVSAIRYGAPTGNRFQILRVLCEYSSASLCGLILKNARHAKLTRTVILPTADTKTRYPTSSKPAYLQCNSQPSRLFAVSLQKNAKHVETSRFLIRVEVLLPVKEGKGSRNETKKKSCIFVLCPTIIV
ncbi:MAG: hypothetical protein ACUVRD_03560 [Bacteroidia bacterium]